MSERPTAAELQQRLGEYRQSYIGPAITWIIMGVAVLGFCLPVLPFYFPWLDAIAQYFNQDRNFAGGIIFVTAFIFAIVGFVLLATNPFIPGFPNRVLTLYEDRFVLAGKKRSITYKWENVGQYFHRVDIHEMYGITLSRQYGLRMKMKDGKVVVFGNSYRKVSDIARLLPTLISRAMRPHIVEQLDSGHKVKFGRVMVSATGLEKGNHKAVWSDVGDVKVEGDYAEILVHRANRKLEKFHRTHINRANALILIRLVRRLAPSIYIGGHI
jgi:hypothetical protein